ncbi:MAG: hypothetical protein IJA14_04120, partial [Alphaproteobacteria bacterium]|nr:hypothetical protein [Alphaproteobacteria bacterium]
VMASVLSSMLGFACYEAEGTLNLRGQVSDSGVPGAAKAARRMMLNENRQPSVENFQQLIWEHPEVTRAAAEYIAVNTDREGNAIGGNNFARFRQSMDESNSTGKVTVPANAVKKNQDGSFSIDFNALNPFMEKSMNAAVMAAKRAKKPNEPKFVSDLRDEFIQIEKDSEEANLPGQPVDQAHQGLYTQQQVDDAVAQEVDRARQGMFDQAAVDDAVNQAIMQARQGMFTQEQLDQEVDLARRDAEMNARYGFCGYIEDYMALPTDQQNDPAYNAVRDVAHQKILNYMALPADQQNDPVLNQIRDAARQGQN